MRIAPSTGTGTSMAALGLRFAFVMGTTFRDLRMAHPRLIYRAGIQSFPSKIFWWFPARIRSTGLALWRAGSDGWSGRASTARPGRVGQTTSAIVETPGNAFYDRLNKILSEHKFDARVEALCRKFYKKSAYGRPSLAPGVYFRALLIGYFEGLDSERGIAWRAADSLSLRGFLGYALDEATPDHSTLSRTRRLYWVETHQAIFRWVVRILTGEGLISGRTVSIDATTLEANAAMKNIVRREDGQTYHEYLKGLALAVGIENPTREQLARLDRKRKKKGSNEQWRSPADPDARITKMKDGRTHLAHKAEHAVDLSSGAVLAITLQPASDGDADTIHSTLAEAQSAAREIHERAVAEVVADKAV